MSFQSKAISREDRWALEARARAMRAAVLRAGVRGLVRFFADLTTPTRPARA
jgi:hypothetical protein